MATDGTRYGRVAFVYDLLAGAWSLGAIGRAKLAALEWIEAGDRVLVAGGGSAEDGVAAAALGARVTTVDEAEAMTRRARRRADLAGRRCGGFGAGSFEARTEDVRFHRPEAPYDVVCLPFLLSAFVPADADELMAGLVALTREGGTVCLAEFAPPRGESRGTGSGGTGFFVAGARRLHYAVVAAVFRVLARNPLRPIPDAVAVAERAGLVVEERRTIGPFFEVVSARKPMPV